MLDGDNCGDKKKKKKAVEGRKSVNQKTIRMGDGLEESNCLKTEAVEYWTLLLFLRVDLEAQEGIRLTQSPHSFCLSPTDS